MRLHFSLPAVLNADIDYIYSVCSRFIIIQMSCKFPVISHFDSISFTWLNQTEYLCLEHTWRNTFRFDIESICAIVSRFKLLVLFYCLMISSCVSTFALHWLFRVQSASWLNTQAWYDAYNCSINDRNKNDYLYSNNNLTLSRADYLNSYEPH